MNNEHHLNSPNQNSINNQQASIDNTNEPFNTNEEIDTQYFVELWEDSSHDVGEDEDLGGWSESSNFFI